MLPRSCMWSGLRAAPLLISSAPRTVPSTRTPVYPAGGAIPAWAKQCQRMSVTTQLAVGSAMLPTTGLGITTVPEACKHGGLKKSVFKRTGGRFYNLVQWRRQSKECERTSALLVPQSKRRRREKREVTTALSEAPARLSDSVITDSFLDDGSGSESASVDENEEGHPFRRSAPTRKAYTRGSAVGMDVSQEDGTAIKMLRSKMFAKTSAKSRRTWLRWWPCRAAARGILPFPLSTWKLELAAALLDRGGYRSADNYLGAMKRSHVDREFEWTAALA